MTAEGSNRLLDDAEAAEGGTESCRASTEKDMMDGFDRLVDAGVIKYDDTYATRNLNIGGLDFEFRISKALETKPSNTTSPPNIGNEAVLLKQRPGSDINTHGFEISRLGQSHFLAFNGFSCYRPHFMILTLDGHRRQWEPLCIDDFEAVDVFLRGYGEDNLVFFNGGAEAGCSRLHKHLQAIPKQSFDGDPWRNMHVNSEAVPFAYFEQKLKPSSSPQETLEVYEAGLDFVEHALRSKTAEQNRAPPHNVILDRERMVVIPRRAAGNGSVGANAAGMLGMVWTQSEEMMQLWLNAGPHLVLEQVGTPKLI